MLDASAEGQEKLPFIKHLFNCSILYHREHFFLQFQLVITLCFGTQWLMNLVILAWLVKLHIVYYLYSYKCPSCCFNLPKILASIPFSSSRFQKEYLKKKILRKIKGLSLTETEICRVSPPDSAFWVFLSWRQDRAGWLEGSHRCFPGNIYLLSPLPFHTEEATQFLILLTSRSNVCVYFLFLQLNLKFLLGLIKQVGIQLSHHCPGI